MTRVTACAVPDTALLRRHADRPGCLSDCFQATLHRPVGLSDLIRAFYGSRAFAPEALILRGATGRDTGPGAVRALAAERSDRYAWWSVEDRSETQLIMAVGDGPIRSWWMVAPTRDGGTDIYFGSAILPRPGPNPKVPLPLRATHGLHKLYSRALLGSAVRMLRTPAGKAGAR